VHPALLGLMATAVVRGAAMAVEGCIEKPTRARLMEGWTRSRLQCQQARPVLWVQLMWWELCLSALRVGWAWKMVSRLLVMTEQ